MQHTTYMYTTNPIPIYILITFLVATSINPPNHVDDRIRIGTVQKCVYEVHLKQLSHPCLEERTLIQGSLLHEMRIKLFSHYNHKHFQPTLLICFWRSLLTISSMISPVPLTNLWSFGLRLNTCSSMVTFLPVSACIRIIYTGNNTLLFLILLFGHGGKASRWSLCLWFCQR